MELDKNSTITMHELTFLKESENEVVVGRPEIGAYITLPPIGYEIIEYLQQGNSLGETEQILIRKYGESIDVAEFVEALTVEYKLVYRMNGVIVNEAVPQQEHGAWIPAQTGRILFHPIACFVYFAILLSAIGVALYDTSYFPDFGEVLTASSTPMIVVISILAAWFLLFLHEMAHLIAARALGVPCRIGLGHRLIFPVAETDMSGIVLVPRNQRYKAYLAGMCWDGVFLSWGIWLQWLYDLHVIFIDGSVLQTIRLINCHLAALLLFQFLFFMKTDLYYVFTNFFRCPNLLEHTYLYFKRIFRKDADTLEQWNEIALREKRMIYAFAWFYMVGVLFTASVGILYQIPNVYRSLADSLYQLSRSSLVSWGFAAGMLLIMVVLLPNALLLWSWLRTVKKEQSMRKVGRGGEYDEKNQDQTGKNR